MKISDESLKSALERHLLEGDDTLNPESIGRYKREARKRFPEWTEAMESMSKLQERYTLEEIAMIAKQERHLPPKNANISFEGSKVKFAFVTDTHFGAGCFDEAYWYAFLDKCKEEKVEFIAHSGDLVDGTPKHRMDTIYGMKVIGYANQLHYARELLSKTDIPIYIISGNHDRFYSDALIVEDACETLPHCHYVGEDKGEINIHTKDGDLNILMWHGNDGNCGQSYSLRVQKIIESLNVYEQPDLLLTGHTHKACSIYCQNRNVYAVSGGALCGQSDWMRAKRLENHCGFYILEATVGKRGIVSLSTTWYPLNEYVL